MNTSNFDELTRAMATNSISRRGAIKGIAASALGGILALGGVGNAFAQSKPGVSPDSKKCPGGMHGCAQPCAGNSSCFCVSLNNGKIHCVMPVCTGIACTKNKTCGKGFVCFNEGCCGTGSFCVPKC